MTTPENGQAREPKRIVSLLPSATEIIDLLGLGDRLCAVSHSCDFPEHVRALPAITSTRIPVDASSAAIDAVVRDDLSDHAGLYALDLALLQKIGPDLVVSQALCDVCAVSQAEVDAALAHVSPRPRLVNMEPANFSEVMEAVCAIGAACGRLERAEREVATLNARADRVRELTARLGKDQRPRVLVLEWIDPPFNAGHWTPELVEWAGGTPLLGSPNQPARTCDPADIAAVEPDVIVLACCGFDLARTLQDAPHLASFPGLAHTPAATNSAIHAVDGKHYFSRPSPRLVDSLEILAHLLHPQLHPAPAYTPPHAWRRAVWPAPRHGVDETSQTHAADVPTVKNREDTPVSEP